MMVCDSYFMGSHDFDDGKFLLSSAFSDGQCSSNNSQSWPVNGRTTIADKRIQAVQSAVSDVSYSWKATKNRPTYQWTLPFNGCSHRVGANLVGSELA